MDLTLLPDGRVETVTDQFGVWGKAFASGGGNDCVETQLRKGVALVRDTQDRSVHLTFGAAAWNGLTAATLQASPKAA